MNKIKPLDQVCSMGGLTPNHVAKLQNKFEFQGTILSEQKVDCCSHYRETALRDKPSCRHTSVGRYHTGTLVDRKYALGIGSQSATGLYKTQVGQSCTKSRYNPKNRILDIFYLEEAIPPTSTLYGCIPARG